MKRSLMALMSIAFVLSLAVIVARAAPTKQKAFASNVVVEAVSLVVVAAPVMIGYDVIENISKESRDLSIAQNTFEGRYIGAAGLSPTRAWRSSYAMSTSGTARSSPTLSMKR